MRSNKKILAVKGFTLVELILYVAMVSVFVTTLVLFSWDVIYGREKARQQMIVQQSARITMAKIAYEIRNASALVNIDSDRLVLDGKEALVTIERVGNGIEMTVGGMGPFSLTSNQILVDELIFEELSSNENDSKHVRIRLVVRQAQEGVAGQLTSETFLEQSVELNGQFNQARALLVDLTQASFINPNLLGISLQNTSQSDIVIDKIFISWSETLGGENVTEIQIGGGDVEWAGSEPNGSLIDIADFTLQVDELVDIDHISFDSDVSGAAFIINFVMLDGSTAKTRLALEVGDEEPPEEPTPTPSPTPTPTPTSTPTPTPTPQITTCEEYCQSLGYSGGTCRRSAGACTQNGEVREQGGNEYCTVSPNTTCCCKP